MSVGLHFKISGATYPGVPHLVYKYFYEFINSARPRSTITTSGFYFESFRTITFSSLRSLCIIPFECKCYIPLNSCIIIFLPYEKDGNPYFWIQPNNETPKFYITMYVEF